jgi:hypothetical protein
MATIDEFFNAPCVNSVRVSVHVALHAHVLWSRWPRYYQENIPLTMETIGGCLKCIICQDVLFKWVFQMATHLIVQWGMHSVAHLSISQISNGAVLCCANKPSSKSTSCSLPTWSNMNYPILINTLLRQKCGGAAALVVNHQRSHSQNCVEARCLLAT